MKIILKINMATTQDYYFLVDDNNEYKKGKDANKNVVATISEYKDILLNKKCLRYLMNKSQCKDHRKGTYEIKKISLSGFDEKL